MKILNIICCFLIANISVFGQQSIKGQLLNEDKTPIEFATISASFGKNIINGAISNTDGTFEIFNLTDFADSIHISYTGKVGGTFALSPTTKDIDLGSIILKDNAKLLEVVEVAAHRVNIVRKVDRLSINVAGQKAIAGETLYDLLLETPGVMLTPKQGISINGKTGLRLKMDESDILLPSDKLQDFLKTISANSIESFDLITKPSAEYEAEGIASIIIVHTKKEFQGKEFNSVNIQGNFSQGKTTNYGAALNMRQITKDYATYLGYSFGRKNTYTEGVGKQAIANSYTLDQSFGQNVKDYNHVVNFGIDRKLNSSQTLGFKITGNLNKGNGPINNTSHYIINNEDSVLTSNSLEEYKEKMLSTNLHYINTFGTKNNKITANIDHIIYNTPHTYQYNLVIPEFNTSELKESLFSEDKVNVNIYSGGLNYEQKLGKGILKSGGKYTFTDTESQLEYFDNMSDNLVLLPGRSSKFDYKEQVMALYSEYSWKKKMWSFNAGLRAEYTEYNTQISEDTYLKLFPSIYLQKVSKKGNIVNLSYNRRIRRPKLNDLNPFELIIDPFTYQRGNPSILPELVNQTELNFILKRQYVFTAGWDQKNKSMNQVSYYDQENDKIIISNINLDKSNMFYVAFSANLQLKKWWSMSGKVQGMYNNIQHDGYKNIGGSSYAYLMSNFTLKKGWTTHIIGQFIPKMREGVYTLKPNGMLIAKLAKNFKNGFNINLSVVDVFNTMKNRLSSSYSGLDFNIEQSYDIQRVKVGISYQVSKGEKAKGSAWEKRKLKEASRIGIK